MNIKNTAITVRILMLKLVCGWGCSGTEEKNVSFNAMCYY